LFHNKSGLQRIFVIFFSLNWDAFDLKFDILSTNSLVVKMIQTPILSDHNDTICTKNQTVIKKVSNNKFFCQIYPLEIQIAQHHFNTKAVYKKQRTAGA